MEHPKIIEIVLNGEKYTWNGRYWIDSSNLMPPTSILSKLDACIKDDLQKEEASISDEKELLARTHAALERKQYDRAEQLIRRVLENNPFNLNAISVLCRILRVKGQPEKAIEETEPFKNSKNNALLTSRAAAFCDLEKWEDAKKQIGQVLSRRGSEEAFMVVKRIKKNRPDLYEKE